MRVFVVTAVVASAFAVGATGIARPRPEGEGASGQCVATVLRGVGFCGAERVRLTVSLGERSAIRKLRASQGGRFEASFELRYGRCGPSLAVAAVGPAEVVSPGSSSRSTARTAPTLRAVQRKRPPEGGPFASILRRDVYFVTVMVSLSVVVPWTTLDVRLARMSWTPAFRPNASYVIVTLPPGVGPEVRTRSVDPEAGNEPTAGGLKRFFPLVPSRFSAPVLRKTRPIPGHQVPCCCRTRR